MQIKASDDADAICASLQTDHNEIKLNFKEGWEDLIKEMIS